MNHSSRKRHHWGEETKVKRRRLSDSDEDTEAEEDVDKIKGLLKSHMGDLFSFKDDHNHRGKINHLYLSGAINRRSASDLIGRLDELNIKMGKLLCEYDIGQEMKIYLHINSGGGEITSAFSIIDAMRRSKFPIVTIVDGEAASAATLISVYGSERWITRHSYMLIHQLSSGCWGKMAEIEDDYLNLKEFMNRIYQIYEEKTKFKRKQLVKLLRHDRWWRAETCLERGLVDKIV